LCSDHFAIGDYASRAGASLPRFKKSVKPEQGFTNQITVALETLLGIRRLDAELRAVSGIELFVVRNHHLGEGLIAPENYVAAVLPLNFEIRFLECGYAIPPRDPRQSGHTARSTASNLSGGTLRPSS
jgi:hypothetical protein